MVKAWPSENHVEIVGHSTLWSTEHSLSGLTGLNQERHNKYGRRPFERKLTWQGSNWWSHHPFREDDALGLTFFSLQRVDRNRPHRIPLPLHVSSADGTRRRMCE